ncbi:MAG TPA: hypothetical protein VGT05_01905 [Patescibacteria group bacterium]|nr:hypothetical protein [Patescibacteria group bacterium]
MDDDQTPIDAEIISDTPNPATNDAQVLTSLDELIKSYIQSIDRLRVEIKKQREMIQDGFVNDPVYREHEEKAKEAAKQKNTTKQQIMKQPAMLILANKVKGMQAEVKEKQLALSDYLLEYQRLSGVNQVEMGDGEVLEIINSAKVVRKSAKGK